MKVFFGAIQQGELVSKVEELLKSVNDGEDI